jgi:TRAP-type mannitol/chloroaromatic compound transport system permease large subunit
VDVLFLLGSLFLLIAIGVPVAYALGGVALAGTIWIDIPLEAVMLKISGGISKFSLLAIPFFVLAGAIMAEGGMARRLIAVAKPTIEEVTAKIWPFYVAMFIVLMLVTYIPAISIWLPRLIID